MERLKKYKKSLRYLPFFILIIILTIIFWDIFISSSIGGFFVFFVFLLYFSLSKGILDCDRSFRQISSELVSKKQPLEPLFQRPFPVPFNLISIHKIAETFSWAFHLLFQQELKMINIKERWPMQDAG